jgi:hypothetical protein
MVSIFDRSVHSLDLIVAPGVNGLGRPVGVTAEYPAIRDLSQS